MSTTDDLFNDFIIKYRERNSKISERYRTLKQRAQQYLNQKRDLSASQDTVWKFLNQIEFGLVDYSEQNEITASGYLTLLELWSNNREKQDMDETNEKILKEEIVKQIDVAEETKMRIVDSLGLLRQMILMEAKLNA